MAQVESWLYSVLAERPSLSEPQFPHLSNKAVAPCLGYGRRHGVWVNGPPVSVLVLTLPVKLIINSLCGHQTPAILQTKGPDEGWGSKNKTTGLFGDTASWGYG